jgi:site-specific recombinase XerD
MKVKKVSDKSGQVIIYTVVDNKNKEIKPVTDFLKFIKVKNYSPNTIKNYAFDLKAYFKYLFQIDKQYDKITPSELVEFLNFLKGGKLNTLTNINSSKSLSVSTIKRVLASISSFYNWLEFSSYVPSNSNPDVTVIGYKGYPTNTYYKSFLSFAKKQSEVKSKFIQIKQPKRLPRPVREDDFNLLLCSLSTWRDKAILFLGSQGGMRIGEMLGLCFEDINFRKKEVKVKFRDNNPNESRVKGMRDRILFIEEPEALHCLNNYILRERPASDSPYIFLSAKGKSRGEALTYQGIYTVFEYHCNKLGIKKNFTIHSLRHAHATKMYEKGMGLLSLQKRLGHASPQTTQIYTQVSDEKLKADYLNVINNLR